MRKSEAVDLKLLPGVSESYVRRRLHNARGREIETGKFMSADSSAALAVNAFAWFAEKPALLHPIPGTEAGWPARMVDIEYCARFPWRGGWHPWLDAFIETDTHILGVESKRHEPFRDEKQVDFTATYDRPVWDGMEPYKAMKDRLKSGSGFKHLDAAQLVKHALGIVTESGRREGRRPILVYLYAEPAARWSPPESIELHRRETEQFAEAVEGAVVRFVPVRWREWVDTWASSESEEVRAHGMRVIKRFDLGSHSRGAGQA